MYDYEALSLSEEEIRRHALYMPLLVKFPNPEIPKMFLNMNDGTKKDDPYSETVIYQYTGIPILHQVLTKTTWKGCPAWELRIKNHEQQ